VLLHGRIQKLWKRHEFGGKMYNRENTEEAMDILHRISTELKAQHKKQIDLVAYLQLPVGTYSAWRAGRSRNYCEHLNAIAAFLEVDAGWLVTGEHGDGIKDVREHELLRRFRKLNAEKQNAVMALME